MAARSPSIAIGCRVIEPPGARRLDGDYRSRAKARQAPSISRTSPRKKEGGLTQGRIDRNLSFVRGTTAKKNDKQRRAAVRSHPNIDIPSFRSAACRFQALRPPPLEAQGPIPGGKEARVEFGLFVGRIPPAAPAVPLPFGHTVRTPISHGCDDRTGPRLANDFAKINRLCKAKRALTVPFSCAPGGVGTGDIRG